MQKTLINIKSLIDRTQLIKNISELEGVLEVVPLFDATDIDLYPFYIIYVEDRKSTDVLRMLENLDYIEYAEPSPKR